MFWPIRETAYSFLVIDGIVYDGTVDCVINETKNGCSLIIKDVSPVYSCHRCEE